VLALLTLLNPIQWIPQKIYLASWEAEEPDDRKFLFDSSNAAGYFLVSMHPLVKFYILVPFCLLFWGCEKPNAPIPQSEFEEKEPTVAEPEPVSILPAPEPKPLPKEKITEKIAGIVEELPLQEKKSEPVLPPFSDELLQAVQNWQKIPKSVFPLEAIGLLERVVLEAKSSNGQVIATSLAESGEEVTALGMHQGKLVVASPNMLKLRGTVDVDQTDFKQMVAYLFELRKEQRERLKNRSTVEKIEAVSSSGTKPDQNEKLDEEIPDPLDFGHGRFCICKECREKRLARAINLKTGHGLEP